MTHLTEVIQFFEGKKNLEPLELDARRLFAQQQQHNPLDFIMTVEQEMLRAYSTNVKRERYLLHQVIRDLDGFNRTKSKYIKQSFNNQ